MDGRGAERGTGGKGVVIDVALVLAVVVWGDWVCDPEIGDSRDVHVVRLDGRIVVVVVVVVVVVIVR